MDRDRFQRVKELFSEALTLAQEARDPFLDRSCGGDAWLRQEVAELLEHTGGGGILGAASASEALALPSAPPSIPGFELIERIATGATGIVFRARQLDPSREVAIKLLRLDGLGPGAVTRFRREAEILAALNHSGIAKVHGAGVAGSPAHPQPWIAMEFVRGVTLDEHLRTTGPSIHRVVQLTAELCNALAHAHQRGFVHRDLKPSNVMIDGDGKPCVLDFGVARVMADAADKSVDTTRTGAVIGTLAYMAPEQARGDRAELDACADVYSLGVMLFEMLCGRLPLEIDDLDLLDAVRTLNEEEPPRIRQLRPDLPPDLDAIVGKCLEKAPGRRYSNAGELGRDLANLLAERPVQARRPTVGYQTRKFIARHRGLTLAAGGVILALSASLIVALYGLRAERVQLERTSETLDFFAGKFSELGPALGFGPEHRPLLESIEQRLRQQIATSPENLALRAALAQTLTDLAWIDQSLGEHASLYARAEEALRIRERIAAEIPNDVATWTSVSELCAKLGESLRDRGDAEAGRRWFARALEIDERLVREHPDDFELLEDLGWSLERLAVRVQAEGDTKREEEVVDRWLSDARRMVEHEPRNWKYVLNLSHAIKHKACVLVDGERTEEALALSLEAADYARVAMGLAPQRRTICEWFVECAMYASKSFSAREDFAKAWPLAQEALTVAEHVAVAEPTNPKVIELMLRAAVMYVPVTQRFGRSLGPARAAEALRHVAAIVELTPTPELAAQLLDQADEFDPPAEGR